MAWKLKYRCRECGYEAEVYEGRGLFRQEIRAVSCPDCKTIQNIVVGGIIADVAPSYRGAKWGGSVCNAAAIISDYGMGILVPSARVRWNRLARKTFGLED